MEKKDAKNDFLKTVLPHLPIPVFFVFVGATLAFFKFPQAFSSGVFHSWDLHSHVAVCARLKEQLGSGRLSFFDPWWFGGWAAFSFYAPLSHLTAVAFSYFLGLFQEDSVQRAVQIISGLSLACLPISVYFAVKRLCFSDQSELYERFFVALFSTLFVVWFLRHPGVALGLGAAAGIELGLFPQVVAWNLLLMYFGCLLSLIRKPESCRRQAALALVLGTLVLTHSLSVLVVFPLGILCILWFRLGIPVMSAHFLGVSVSAFWLLPSVLHAGENLPQDRMLSISSLFTLLFPELSARTGSSWGPAGLFSLGTISGATLLILLACVLFFRSRTARENRILRPTMVIVFFLSFLFTSEYFALACPVSVHLYRFLPLFLLLALTLFAALLSLAAIRVHSPFVLMFFLVLFLLQEWRLYKPETAEVGSREQIFAEEEKLLLALGRTQSQEKTLDRVFFEHLGRPGSREFPSPHYLPARLSKVSGRETANGLFIQSSLSQAFPAFAATRLKIHSYNAGLNMGLSTIEGRENLVRRLRDFGITDLVLGPGGGGRISNEAKEFGRYTRVQLMEPSEPMVKASEKTLIGFRNEGGRLSFKRFEAMVYGDDELWDMFDFLEIRKGQNTPGFLAKVLLSRPNGSAEKIPLGPNEILLPVPLGSGLEDIPEWEFRDRRLREWEAAVLETLHGRLKTVSRVDESRSGENEANEPPPEMRQSEGRWPELRFEEGFQEMILSGLTAGEPVRINYSYVPFWSSEDGELYRGLSERIWFLPRGETAKIRYSVRNAEGALAGLGITALSLVLLLRLLLLPNRQIQKPDYTSSDDTEMSES